MDLNDEYLPVLECAMKHSLEYLSRLPDTPVAASASWEELRQRLHYALEENGLSAVQVIEDLVADTSQGILANSGGRFFAWVIGGVVPAALAADWLTSVWDQNAAIHASGPAEAVIEEVCGAWLKELLGLPMSASFALVTGCQMAHVTCLAAARHAILMAKNWDVERQGLHGAPKIRILTSEECHGSTMRAIRILGLGSDSVVSLPVCEQGFLEKSTLEQALQQDPETATIVVLQAGDLNIGAYDPFAELIPVAHQFNAWVHIDGAFGLWVAASEKYRHLLEGVAQADSWATDGHKWLNVPYDCGYAFVANPKHHAASMSYRASYLIHDEHARDQMDWNPEWSRRGRGVATYAAIRQLGRRGISDLIENACRHAHRIVTSIAKLSGVELVWEPTINQGLLRFLDPAPNATEQQHDAYTDMVIKKIVESGEAFFGGTTWRGKRCMRVSVCNWQTTDEDVERVIEAVEKILDDFI